jgi:hypothetical protein
MTGVQRLFDNPYTPRPGLFRVAMRNRSSPSRRGPVGALVVLLPALLLLAAATGAGLRPPAIVQAGYTSYDSGRLNVVFPSPLPGVELFQDANSSVGAAVFVDQVIELTPVLSAHPLVGQFATPTANTPFTPSTPTSGSGSFDLALHGALPVVRTEQPLWATPGGLPANATAANTTQPTGTASLTVSYALLPAGSDQQGLDLSFNIHNWPWLSPSDLLGVELRFVVFNATDFATCPGTTALGATGASGCAGSSLGLGSIVWDPNGVASLIGRDPSGFAAGLAWSDTAQGSTGSATGSIVVGAYHALANTTRLSLLSAANGSSNLTTAGEFLLSAPPLAPLKLVGDAPVYLLSAVGFAAVGLGGIVVYRRRDRRLRESL